MGDSEHAMSHREAQLAHIPTPPRDPESAHSQLSRISPSWSSPFPQYDPWQLGDDTLWSLGYGRPIPYLNIDVLGKIFVAWRDADTTRRCVPHHASSVCRLWRAAAHRTPRLWTVIDFSFQRMSNRPAWLEYHACFARHAGALGYVVELSLDVETVPATDRVWADFSTTILAQARIINVEVLVARADANVLIGLSLPRLLTLRVHESKRLRDSTAPEDTATPEFEILVDAPGIQHLEMWMVNMTAPEDDGADGDSVDVDAADLDNDDDAEDSDAGDDEIDDSAAGVDTLSRISSLNMSCADLGLPYFLYLASCCAHVTEFTLRTDCLWFEAAKPFVWHSLEFLRVTIQDVLDGEFIPAHMKLPSLETLEVDDNGYNWDFWRDFIQVSCPALTHLCVLNLNVDSRNTFTDAMGSLSRLKRLTFRDFWLDESLVTHLVEPGPAMEIPFPALQSITFEDVWSIPEFESAGIQVGLRKRYTYLAKHRLCSPFSWTVRSSRVCRDDIVQQLRERLQQDVLRYNEEELQRFQTKRP